MKIVVAIPNYNNNESLVNLVKQLLADSFYKIYVLDDCSSNISDIKKALKNLPVEIVTSTKRLLPTKNRNRVVNLDMGDVVLFLDSDLVKISNNVSDEIRDIFQDEKLAILGGRILENGIPMKFGYGSGPFWPIDQSWLFAWVRPISKALSRIFQLKKPANPINVTWVAEGVMAIRSTVFNELGGFDANFELFHEGPDICFRAINKGYRVMHDPRIIFEHLHIEHMQKRNNINRSTALWFYKHYGWPKWLVNFMFKYDGRDIDDISAS